MAEEETLNMPNDIGIDDGHDDIVYPSALPFIAIHLACFAAIWSGITWQAVVLCVALYWIRMFAITAGYHRYFAHRAYATSRIFQFVLALLAQTSAQKGVLWWSATHRHHHLYSDTRQDVHSPRHKGFLHSHLGWMFTPKHDVIDFAKIADLARYPELMWLQKYEVVPPITLGAICYLVAGWPGLVVGFCWSTVLLFHAVFCINSLAHVHGRQHYVTGDDSRNNWFLALITMGEGWHNNHHAYQSSVRQGFRWWEIDLTYYILKLLAWIGVVWGLKTPPQAVLRNEQRLGARVIARAAEQLAANFDSERIALAINSAMQGPELLALRRTLREANQHTAIKLTGLRLPDLPTREELLAKADSVLAYTASLDDIVDRAYQLLLASIGAQLGVSAEE
jgi:stearoyl-CoA desaturase (delta-9 desaturase)